MNVRRERTTMSVRTCSGTTLKPQRRQEYLIAESLASGRSVVVDNTNPSVAVRAPLVAMARRHGAEVVGYFFITEAADALRRNARAKGGNASLTWPFLPLASVSSRRRWLKDSIGCLRCG